MKILIQSDLHFECYKDLGIQYRKDLSERIKKEPIDVLVLAGDIISTTYSQEFFQVFEEFNNMGVPVIYTPGNHEYYGNHPQEVEAWTDLLPEAFDDNRIQVLNNTIVTIGSQRFIGGTGWFKRDRNVTYSDKSCMGDFHYIKNFEPWVYKKNSDFKELLDKHLSSEDIVVSHHLPSYMAVAPIFKNSRLNYFFVNDNEAIIKAKQPKLWIFGHTHFTMDFDIGLTRCVANPRGYPSEHYSESKNFNPYLIIEV